jgi:hypothetical protein
MEPLKVLLSHQNDPINSEFCPNTKTILLGPAVADTLPQNEKFVSIKNCDSQTTEIKFGEGNGFGVFDSFGFGM